MPLTDLVRHLNARSAAEHPARGAPFLAEDGRVYGQFAGRRLESHFLPIVETATGKLHGHAASLRVRVPASRQTLDASGVFVLVKNDEDFIYLDRLIRTLHALNYLTRPTRGNLLLRVHPRHVLGVAGNHGLAFEEILRPCGLVPDQITLELDVDGVKDEARFLQAIQNYRSRGYGIAIGYGPALLDIDLAHRVRPDLVRLGPSLLNSGPWLGRLARELHGLGVRTLMEGVSTALLDGHAGAADIDFVQAYLPLATEEEWPLDSPLAA